MGVFELVTLRTNKKHAKTKTPHGNEVENTPYHPHPPTLESITFESITTYKYPSGWGYVKSLIISDRTSLPVSAG